MHQEVITAVCSDPQQIPHTGTASGSHNRCTVTQNRLRADGLGLGGRGRGPGQSGLRGGGI